MTRWLFFLLKFYILSYVRVTAIDQVTIVIISVDACLLSTSAPSGIHHSVTVWYVCPYEGAPSLFSFLIKTRPAPVRQNPSDLDIKAWYSSSLWSAMFFLQVAGFFFLFAAVLATVGPKADLYIGNKFVQPDGFNRSWVLGSHLTLVYSLRTLSAVLVGQAPDLLQVSAPVILAKKASISLRYLKC